MDVATLNECIEVQGKVVVIHDLDSLKELTYYGWYTLFYDPVDGEVRTLGDIFQSLHAEIEVPPSHYTGTWLDWYTDMVSRITDEDSTGIEMFLDWASENDHEFYQFDSKSPWTYVNKDLKAILLLLP